MPKAIALALTLLLGQFAVAQAGEQDFKLINDSGRPVCDVYISPADATDWQEDLLEGDKYCLSHGESINITFGRSLKGVKMWDLRVVDDKGNDSIYEGFNLMEVSNIKLLRNGTADYW
ncbi:MAG: hypothetical protein K6F46_03765 [Desulfovibrio sp.]|nr:hypothetical protein [Desulfovibrio sp.]